MCCFKFKTGLFYFPKLLFRWSSLFILRKQESASQKHDNQKLQDRVHMNIQTNVRMDIKQLTFDFFKSAVKGTKL